MTTTTPVRGEALEKIVCKLPMTTAAQDVLLACCNRADNSKEPQQRAIGCPELNRGNLPRAIRKYGVVGLGALLERNIELTATYLVVHPHRSIKANKTKKKQLAAA